MAKLEVKKGTYVLFGLLTLGVALGNMSQTGFNALLISAMHDLGIDMQAAQWLSTGYMLVMGVAVPLATYLYEKLSIKSYTILSYALFACGSFIDTMAPEFYMMLLGRIIQAVAVALFIPALQTVAITRFPAGYKATAMGIAGIALGVAPNAGPTLSGYLDTNFGWRSFSLVLFVLSAVFLFASIMFIRRESVPESNLVFEKISFIFSILGFGGILLGLSQVGSYGVLSWWFFGPMIVGIVFLVLFVHRQQELAEPFMDLRIFRSKSFVGGLVAIAFLFASYMGVTLVIPQYVQNALGGTSLAAGFVLLPGVLSALITNPIAGVLTDKTNPRLVCIIFGTFLSIGAIGCVFCLYSSKLILLAIFQMVRCVGISGLIGPTTTYMLSGLKGFLVAHGSSASVVIRQISGTFGTACNVLCIVLCQPFVVSGTCGIAFPYIVALAFSALMAFLSLFFIVWKIKIH